MNQKTANLVQVDCIRAAFVNGNVEIGAEHGVSCKSAGRFKDSLSILVMLLMRNILTHSQVAISRLSLRIKIQGVPSLHAPVCSSEWNTKLGIVSDTQGFDKRWT